MPHIFLKNYNVICIISVIQFLNAYGRIIFIVKRPERVETFEISRTLFISLYSYYV